jgi:hypothetical protein
MEASRPVSYVRVMKRMDLFEDSPRFPGWLRDMMTAYIGAFHRVFRTAPGRRFTEGRIEALWRVRAGAEVPWRAADWGPSEQ